MRLSETIGIADWPWAVRKVSDAQTTQSPPRPGVIRGLFGYLLTFAPFQSQETNLVWGKVVGYGVNGRSRGEDTHPYVLQKMDVAVNIDSKSIERCKRMYKRDDAMCAFNPKDFAGVGLGKVMLQF